MNYGGKERLPKWCTTQFIWNSTATKKTKTRTCRLRTILSLENCNGTWITKLNTIIIQMPFILDKLNKRQSWTGLSISMNTIFANDALRYLQTAKPFKNSRKPKQICTIISTLSSDYFHGDHVNLILPTSPSISAWHRIFDSNDKNPSISHNPWLRP